MRWWDRFTAELRSLLGRVTLDGADRWYAAPTASNEPVGVERAVGVSAVWACVALISGSIASTILSKDRRSRTRWSSAFA